MTHTDFISTTTNAPHIENVPLTENANSSYRNLGAEPTINENEGAPLVNMQESLEENEAPPANDPKEEPQQENDEPQPIRRSQHERKSVISNDYCLHE
jgi:hypothetical protein